MQSTFISNFSKPRQPTITVMRHAETVYNAPRVRIQGSSPSSDIVLSDKGRAEVFAKLKAIKLPDVIILSPLLRCKQTAEAWADMDFEKIKSKKLFHNGLREVDAGWLEGLYVDEVKNSNAYRPLWKLWKEQPLNFPGFPGGETLQAFQMRVLNAFSAICNQSGNYQNQDVCIITHGGPMRILKCFLENKDLSHLWDVEIANLERITLTEEQIKRLQHDVLLEVASSHFQIKSKL
jgi:broad specificity phosphatase PhoE